VYEFENIKNNVSIIDVAEHYCLEVHKGGMCCCPFHNEKTPSMKLYTREQGKDEGFHCFGCGKSGDAISLTAELLGISQIKAAKKIDDDFGLGIFEKSNKNITNFSNNQKLHREEKQKEEKWIASAYKIAIEYNRVLDLWKKWYAPKSMNEPLKPLFQEAIAQKERITMNTM
jgi:DNA primase